MIKDGFSLSHKNRWKIQYLKKFNMKIYKMKPEPGQNGALKINIGNGRLGQRTDIFGTIWGQLGHFNGLRNSTFLWSVKKLTLYLQ